MQTVFFADPSRDQDTSPPSRPMIRPRNAVDEILMQKGPITAGSPTVQEERVPHADNKTPLQGRMDVQFLTPTSCNDYAHPTSLEGPATIFGAVASHPEPGVNIRWSSTPVFANSRDVRAPCTLPGCRKIGRATCAQKRCLPHCTVGESCSGHRNVIPLSSAPSPWLHMSSVFPVSSIPPSFDVHDYGRKTGTITSTSAHSIGCFSGDGSDLVSPSSPGLHHNLLPSKNHMSPQDTYLRQPGSSEHASNIGALLLSSNSIPLNTEIDINAHIYGQSLTNPVQETRLNEASTSNDLSRCPTDVYEGLSPFSAAADASDDWLLSPFADLPHPQDMEDYTAPGPFPFALISHQFTDVDDSLVEAGSTAHTCVTPDGCIHDYW